MCESCGYVEGQSKIIGHWIFWKDGDLMGMHKGEKTLDVQALPLDERYKIYSAMGQMLNEELLLIDTILSAMEVQTVAQVLDIPADPRMN